MTDSRRQTPAGVLSPAETEVACDSEPSALLRRGAAQLLEPHLMMLLPEKRQLYIVYRHFFTLQATPAEQRSFRIRLAEGWFARAPKRMEKATS